MKIKLAWSYMSLFVGYCLMFLVNLELVMRMVITLLGGSEHLKPLQTEKTADLIDAWFLPSFNSVADWSASIFALLAAPGLMLWFNGQNEISPYYTVMFIMVLIASLDGYSIFMLLVN